MWHDDYLPTGRIRGLLCISLRHHHIYVLQAQEGIKGIKRRRLYARSVTDETVRY